MLFDIVMVQEVGVATVQLEVHPANVDPVAGLAVRVTTAPSVKLSPQTVPPLPHAINGAVPLVVVTEPVPDPNSYTESTGGTTTGAVVVEDSTVTLTDAVTTEPLVVNPIAVIVGE